MEAHYSLVETVAEQSRGGQGERLALRIMEAITWLRLSVNRAMEARVKTGR
jgi:hypothetical protein